MTYQLFNVRQKLYELYDQLQIMQKSLKSKQIHTPGGLQTIKSRKKSDPTPEIYYVYRENGHRKSKRISPDKLDICQKQIQLMKSREQALKYVNEQLDLIEKCLKTLKLDPTQRPSLPSASATSSPQKQQSSPNIPYPQNLKHPTLVLEYK